MDYTVRPYRHGEEQYVAEAQSRIYSREYHWGDTFIDYAEKIALDFAAKARNSKEELWVAEKDGELIGCIMLCQTEEIPIGQLRLFSVEKEYRHCGVGSALSKALLAKAKAAGYKELILWTASPLTDAIRHYEKLGFHCVEKVPNRAWSIDGEMLYEVKMAMKLE